MTEKEREREREREREGGDGVLERKQNEHGNTGKRGHGKYEEKKFMTRREIPREQRESQPRR